MKTKGGKRVERMTEQMENYLILLQINVLLSKGYSKSIAYSKLRKKLSWDMQTALFDPSEIGINLV